MQLQRKKQYHLWPLIDLMFNKYEHKVAMLMRLIVGPLGPKRWQEIVSVHVLCFQVLSLGSLQYIFFCKELVISNEQSLDMLMVRNQNHEWKNILNKLGLQISSMFELTWRVSKQLRRWLLLTLMLTSILPNLQEIPCCFMQQHQKFL